MGSTLQAQDWRIEILNDMSSLKEHWQRLCSAKNNASIFQQFALLEIFFKSLKENNAAEPLIAVARTHNGDPVAIFPFTKFRRRGMSWIASADHGVLDLCSPILCHEMVTGDNISALIHSVRQALPRSDVLYFNKLPQFVGGHCNPLGTLSAAERLPMSHWVVDLSQGSEQHLTQNTSSKFRSTQRRRVKAARTVFDCQFNLWKGMQVDENVFERVREMRTVHFQGEGRSDSVNSEAWSSFYKNLALNDKDDVECWVAELSFDGKPAAMHLGLCRDDYAIGMLSATNTRDFAKFGPGTQLVEAVMKEFSAKGVKTLDMSIGDWPYKKSLGASKNALYDILVPRTLVGLCYSAYRTIKLKLRKSRFRDDLAGLRKRFLATFAAQ